MTVPILLIHGALGAADQMQALAEALGGPAPVDTLELPGHGDTPLGARPFTIAGFVDAVRHWLLAHPGPAPLVFGYSMGGYVALAVESEHPGSLAGIVTLGTKYDWTPETAAADLRRLEPEAIRHLVPSFAATLAARHVAEGWELNVERTAALIRGLGEAPALTAARLGQVRCPVRCAVGASDHMVSARETAALAAACRGVSEVLVDVPHPLERVPVGTLAALVRSMSDSVSRAGPVPDGL